MQVIRTIPLAALPNTVPQILDYFWSAPLPEGSLVKMTVGRRQVMGLVLESLDLAQAKLAVKKSSFGLKKLNSVLTEKPQATAGQLGLIRWMAKQYCVPLGLCAKTVLPQWLGKRGHMLELGESPALKKESSLAALLITQPDTALAEIDKIISKSKGTVLLLVPEVMLAKTFAERLRGHGPVVIHSEMTSTAHAKAYKAVLLEQPRLIIGTRLALFLPFRALATVIMEDPLHEAYKSDMSPRYAAPDTVRELAAIHGADLVFLSPSMSTVNFYLQQKGVITFKDRKPHWPRIVESDMNQERQHNPSVLSRPVQDAILDTYEDRKPLLLFSPRRSYATHVDCERCHASVLCATCGIPMRLNRHAGENMLVCYHCTAFTQVPKQCPSCKGGRLKAAGLAGSQQIAQATNTCLDRHGLAKLDIPILDTDLVRSPADEKDVLDRFRSMERPVIVATQKIFSQRYTMKFDRIAVIEADALVYNPDFRTQERLIYQLEKLADFGPETMYLQTWDRHGALAHTAGRNWDEFYKTELSDRKVMGWPPFVRLVKLTFAGQDRTKAEYAARLTADRLRRASADMNLAKSVSVLGPTPALVERAGGRWTQNIILKTSLAPDKLNALLAHSEPGGTIDIDPRSIT